MAQRLLVDLRHQGTGGVEIEEIARRRIRRHGFRHAMGEKTTGWARCSSGISSSSSTKIALGLEPFHDIAIVDDFVADIDRLAIGFERQHDDLDRAVDAGAEAARAQRRMVSGVLVMSGRALEICRSAGDRRNRHIGIGEGQGNSQREECGQALNDRMRRRPTGAVYAATITQPRKKASVKSHDRVGVTSDQMRPAARMPL